MDQAQLAAQAQQAAAQNAQMEASDQSQISSSQGNYNTYSGQATQATQQAQAAAQQAQAQAQYMQGAGSGLNQYNLALGQQEGANNWNPAQLSSANQSLFGLSGALNGANAQFAAPGGGGQGVSASQLGGYEQSILNPLQAGVQNANTQVGALNTEYSNLTNAAAQGAGAQVQTEQGALTGFNATAAQYTAAAQTYQSQAAAALQNLQFYQGLYQSQGQLNEEEQAGYAQSIQGYTTAAANAASAYAAAKAATAQAAGYDITDQANINKFPKGTVIGGFTSDGSGVPSTPSTPVPNVIQGTNPNPAQPKQSGGSILSSILNPLGSGIKDVSTDLNGMFAGLSGIR